MIYRVTGADLREQIAEVPHRATLASGRSQSRTILPTGLSRAPSHDTSGPERSPNHLLQRTGAERCGFMSHRYHYSVGFGQRPLPAPVAEYCRSH
jgi:hypothetical protein